jgi:hypothetical protein
MKKKALLLLLAAYGPCHAQVTATVRMDSTSAIELQYDIPKGCQALVFKNEGIRPQPAATMRHDWIVLDACAKISADGIQLQGDACTSVRIRVPASTQDLDRVYPWAYPLGGALYSHTSAFAVQPTCGPVNWTFEASGGRVVVNGETGGSRAQRAPAPVIDYMPVFFLEGQAAPGEQPGQYIDTRFAPETVEAVRHGVEAVYGHYRRSMPGLNFTQPYLVAVTSPKRGQMRGDVAGKTMRLMLPATLTDNEQADMNYLIAHEAAHMLQPESFNDKWKEQTIIKEGGADFISWLTGAQLGWRGRADAAATIENAINKCVIALGRHNWSKFEDRNWSRTPYNCGLALHVLALVEGNGQPAPMLALRDYYRDAKEGRPTDLAQALECGTSAGCTARWLPRFLGPDEPFHSVMNDYAQKSKLLATAPVLTLQQLAPVARNLVAELMARDCGGQISFYTKSDQFLIAQVRLCKNLREGMAVVRAQGASLFTDPASVIGLVKACHGAGKATLGLADGTNVEIECDKSLPAVPELYTIDAARLYMRLGIR